MLEQAERAIDEFERKWPKEEYQMLVGFDNSSNHNAYAPDALKTAGLNVGDTSNRKAEMPPSRDGWYWKDNEKVVQKMNGLDGKRLGMETILLERGRIKKNHGLVGDCLACKKDKERGNEDRYKLAFLERNKCCMRKILSLEPDFLAQKTRLEEVRVHGILCHFRANIFFLFLFPAI